DRPSRALPARAARRCDSGRRGSRRATDRGALLPTRPRAYPSGDVSSTHAFPVDVGVASRGLGRHPLFELSIGPAAEREPKNRALEALPFHVFLLVAG